MEREYFLYAKDCLKKSILKICKKDGGSNALSVIKAAFDIEFHYPNLPRGVYYSKDDIQLYRWELMRAVHFYVNANGNVDGLSNYLDFKGLDKNKLLQSLIDLFRAKYFPNYNSDDDCYFLMLLVTDSPMPLVINNLDPIETKEKMIVTFAKLFDSLSNVNIVTAIDLSEYLELIPSLVKCYTKIYNANAPYIDVEIDKLLIECNSVGARKYVESLNNLIKNLVSSINEKIIFDINSTQLCENLWHQFVDSHAFELGVHFVAQINQQVNEIYLSKVELDSRDHIFAVA